MISTSNAPFNLLFLPLARESSIKDALEQILNQIAIIHRKNLNPYNRSNKISNIDPLTYTKQRDNPSSRAMQYFQIFICSHGRIIRINHHHSQKKFKFSFVLMNHWNKADFKLNRYHWK